MRFKAAEELFSTAEERASQSQALLQLMNYCKVNNGDSSARKDSRRT